MVKFSTLGLIIGLISLHGATAAPPPKPAVKIPKHLYYVGPWLEPGPNDVINIPANANFYSSHGHAIDKAEEEEKVIYPIDTKDIKDKLVRKTSGPSGTIDTMADWTTKPGDRIPDSAVGIPERCDASWHP
ncbi:hypothetical protein MCOR05_010468 [Pyricularia oryzae]|nr:hypothetical protein MCOR05_010468 [Pyricularia oryzae]